MCTVLFSYSLSTEEPLFFLANRDEFYDRPAAKAARWEDHPTIFAGRDLVGSGTWLGVTNSGRIAAVTNFRDPAQPQGKRSRGALVTNFLISNESPSAYLSRVKSETGLYTGFNLLAGTFGEKGHELCYYSNRADGKIRRLTPGIYGLSNHLLDTPWPKVVKGKAMLEEALSADVPEKEDLFRILADRTLADDEMLPDTGVGYEIEKVLSAIFIETRVYGTRCSTVITADASGNFDFEERVFA